MNNETERTETESRGATGTENRCAGM